MTNPHVVVKARDVDLVVNGEPLLAGHGREVPMVERNASVAIARADVFEASSSEEVMEAIREKVERADEISIAGTIIGFDPASEVVSIAGARFTLETIMLLGNGETTGQHVIHRDEAGVVTIFKPQLVDLPARPDGDGGDQQQQQERRGRAGTFKDRDSYDPELKVGWTVRESDAELTTSTGPVTLSVATAAGGAETKLAAAEDKPPRTPPASRKRHKA